MLAALMTAVGSALAAPTVGLLRANPESGRLEIAPPLFGSGRIEDVVPAVSLAPGDDTLPQRALRGRSVLVERGPRTAGDWAHLCSDLGIGTAMAVSVGTSAVPGVLLVGDPGDPQAAATLGALRTDVSTAVTIVDRLREADRRSERAAEAASLSADLVAIVSHELRTPLTSIIGALQTLQRPEFAHDDPAAADLVQAALNQTDRLKVLVDDLLVASRLDRHVLPVRMRPVDVARLAHEAVAGVPGAAEVFVVLSRGDAAAVLDGDHLGRILRNLIENVLRHAPGSHAQIRAETRPDVVEIVVSDTGPGIDESVLPRLFERSAPPAGTDGGLGLGLAIARGLAEAMEGTIDHAETPGGGATFRVELPNRAP
ncbi:MAG: HAMP domain-containing sensor histidine kinase [Acidimicrobiia bacterium]|nr:HAMP domain-containing sensor histidine kinase [Acidimicrobiia bacterium]